MRWLLYIKIVCGNKKNLVLTHSNFYIFVFLVLKGDVVEMNETDKGKNNNDSNILENSMLNIDNPNYLKGKDFINRASIINNRPTRTSTVYELEGNPKNSKEVLKFIKTNKDSLGLHSISIVKEKNAEEGVEEDNKINNKDKNEENKNLKILIETYGEDADEFENKFNENKKNNNLNDLELKKVRELYAVDLGKDEKNAEVELTDYEQKVIKRLNSKKFWILKTMSKEAQVGFIDKLIKLANDKYNKQREKLFDRHSTSEYRYFLNLIFNSGCLTFDALVNLANFVSTREISPKNFTSTYEEVESCWNNYFADLGYRDMSGKRDRLRVMIGPEFQARLIAHYIKLFTYLKQQNGLNEEQRKKQYQDAIQIAKSEYSKTSREFWSSFLLYVVGASFLVTLAGLVVTALLSLSGFAALAPCVVLLVATLIGTGLKFRTDYKIWPWDWVYWWKDAKGNCLKVLQSDYMKSVLINGKTDKLDKEIRQTQTKEEIEMIENKNRERPNNNTSEIIMLKSMKMAEENIPAGGNEQPDSNAKSNIKNNPGDSVITKP